MKQFSIDGNQVELELLSGDLLFIDPLYFQDISNDRQQLDTLKLTDRIEFLKAVEEKIFPYSGGFILGYKYVDNKMKHFAFNPEMLKRWNTVNQRSLAISKRITTFGVDTSSFLIVDLDNLYKLLDILTYDNLVEALLSNKLDNLFETINNELGNKGWAYVVTENSNTNSEFNGDGFYVVL